MNGTPWQPPALSGPSAAPDLHLHVAVAEQGALLSAAVSWAPSYRVIAREYAGENLFDRIADDSALDDLRAVADLTRPRSFADAVGIDLAASSDTPTGPGAGFIRAAFSWPGRPSRFSDGTLGTWYAARDEATAIAETRFHDAAFLKGSGPVVLEKTVLTAELRATCPDVRSGRPAPAGLDHPTDYAAGQAFGGIVRRLGGDGVLYHSVRHRTPDGAPLGECVAVFRASALRHAAAARTLAYAWDGTAIGTIE